MSRAKTPEEVRQELLSHLRVMAHYWATLPAAKLILNEDGEIAERLDGLVFSFLVLLDGGTLALPAFDLYPAPHPEDKAFHEREGEDYYDPDVCVNECQLHDLWTKPARDRATILPQLRLCDVLLDPRIQRGEKWFTIDDPRFPFQYNIIEDEETIVAGDGWNGPGLDITPKMLGLLATIIDPPKARQACNPPIADIDPP